MSEIFFALSEMHWIAYVFLGLSIVSGVVAYLLSMRMKQDDMNPLRQQATEVDYPVIGYKTANLAGIRLSEDGDITEIVFRGLVGNEYEVQDATDKHGHKKFNMYADAELALKHEQNWGSTFVEAIGYGSVEEHQLGYTTQNQRVLQVAFMECSMMYAEEIKCKNVPEYLARSYRADGSTENGYKTYCAGCRNWFDDVRLLARYYNRSFTLSDGSVIVIIGKSSRQRIEFVPTVIKENGDTASGATSPTNQVNTDAVQELSS